MDIITYTFATIGLLFKAFSYTVGFILIGLTVNGICEEVRTNLIKRYK